MTTSTRIVIPLSKENRIKISNFVKTKTSYRSITSYVRALIEADLKEKGEKIDFDISDENWGGDRKTKTKKE